MNKFNIIWLIIIVLIIAVLFYFLTKPFKKLKKEEIDEEELSPEQLLDQAKSELTEEIDNDAKIDVYDFKWDLVQNPDEIVEIRNNFLKLPIKSIFL
jgi:membrane protein implicated in regulation of membrane protease activity